MASAKAKIRHVFGDTFSCRAAPPVFVKLSGQWPYRMKKRLCLVTSPQTVSILSNVNYVIGKSDVKSIILRQISFSKPCKLCKPCKPCKPLNHVHHVNPVNPVNRVNLVNHVNHVNSVNSVNLVNHVNHVNPVNLVNSVNPVNYVNLVNPLNLIKTL